ncbi:MAG TPA: hypothetical protein PLG15_01170 [Candidatus Gastranaerophilaceae bacterium]|nr:hypothetical protein [Candidatus Gastranaerophilaceae bacterium]HPT40978.1 hypothetical protein [Candidatus Gastranaerophilaceae bacterium]
MKKNLKIIQINGFRGILLGLFIVSCLIAGFIAFPAFLTMNGWNYLSSTTGSFPPINFTQGVLLWGIIVLSIYIFNKKKFIVSFNARQELSDEELSEVISKIRAQTIKNGLLQDRDKNIENKNQTEEDLELHSENKE